MSPTRRIALLIAYLAAASCLMLPARGQQIIVSPEGPVNSISEAVRNASPGTRIIVRAGTYREGEILVDRPVEIVGVGEPVLYGAGDHQLMRITADNVAVSGLVFRNVATSFVEDRAALFADGADGCRIQRNRFENTFFGIKIAKSSGCYIEGNRLRGENAKQTTSGNGIHVWYSRDVTIRNNEVKGHRDGIYLEFTRAARVLNNRSEGNLRYGLHFMFSDSCAYHENVFTDNEAGVAVMYSKQVEMMGNRFEHNWGPASFGLLLKEIADSRIEQNTFSENTVGVYAESVNRTQVIGNDFYENGWAIKIMANALDNRFARNNFVGNSFDVATNSRQHFSTFEGNYWDNYEGYDLDRDGIGDVPFRPVRLFALLVEQNEPALLLMRSLFVSLLDAAERVIPALTPETLVDTKPAIRRLP